MKRGVLLINLGTPKSTRLTDVRTFLREFLLDSRVIDLPAVLRYLLVYGFILPSRAKKSSHAYQLIWTETGSPLLCHSLNLLAYVQKKVDTECRVILGMRYGKPSIEDGLRELRDCESITVLPLYPQYSSAASGSAIEEVLRFFSSSERIPSLRLIANFFQHPAYIKAQASQIKTYLNNQDYLLLSYHGIPQRQLVKGGCKKMCADICPDNSENNLICYRAQCHKTTQLLAEELNWPKTQFGTSFQSRLGKTPWIKPWTDEILVDLAAKGIKNLAIACPSFVTDCLETLEEIGIRTRQQWLSLGGSQFTLIPSMNDNPLWVDALLQITQS